MTSDMKDFIELFAMKLYEAKKDIEFRRITFSKTSLKPPAWKDCHPKERVEWLEAVRHVLMDEEIMQTIINRAAGL